MYVLDSVKDALFVYDFETGELIAEYPFDKLNKSPRGIWSDGVTLWVSDDGAKRLFAYRIDEGALVRHEDEEFTFRSLLKAGNGSPRGIWSDGDVMFVIDEQDDKVYSYNIPDKIIAQLASLGLSGTRALRSSHPNRRAYTGMADCLRFATVTTIEAIATQEAATVDDRPGRCRRGCRERPSDHPGTLRRTISVTGDLERTAARTKSRIEILVAQTALFGPG